MNMHAVFRHSSRTTFKWCSCCSLGDSSSGPSPRCAPSSLRRSSSSRSLFSLYFSFIFFFSFIYYLFHYLIYYNLLLVNDLIQHATCDFSVPLFIYWFINFIVPLFTYLLILLLSFLFFVFLLMAWSSTVPVILESLYLFIYFCLSMACFSTLPVILVYYSLTWMYVFIW